LALARLGQTVDELVAALGLTGDGAPDDQQGANGKIAALTKQRDRQSAADVAEARSFSQVTALLRG